MSPTAPHPSPALKRTGFELVLDGGSLHAKDLAAFVRDDKARITIHEAALERVAQGERFLNSQLDGKVIYGINTGFGPMASHLIGANQLKELQLNLIRSHAVGMGDPLPSEFVLAAMVVRLNTLLKGYSGVSAELVTHLAKFIDHRITPIVPEHGAVGTSGDLVQLAHIALGLIGEGTAEYQGRPQKMDEILAAAGLTPYELKAKEGLALINGTAMMTGIGALLIDRAEQLVGIAVQNGALALELIHAFEDGISEALHALRPHPGQVLVAKTMRNLLADSSLLGHRKALKGKGSFAEGVKVIPESVQEIYSLRCTPQVLGPVVDALAHAREVLETELNSVTDNPILHEEKGEILHGGNFHGDYVAYAVDQLKMTLVKLTMLSERRINFFLSEKVNKTFPPFMNLGTPGLTLGLQGLQFVATSTTAQSQTLAFPQYVHSISTNGENQDIVSMGTDAALLATKVAENALTVLAIETAVLAQGVDHSGEREKLASASKAAYEAVRAVLPPVKEDRSLAEEMKMLKTRLGDPQSRIILG